MANRMIVIVSSQVSIKRHHNWNTRHGRCVVDFIAILKEFRNRINRSQQIEQHEYDARSLACTIGAANERLAAVQISVYGEC